MTGDERADVQTPSDRERLPDWWMRGFYGHLARSMSPSRAKQAPFRRRKKAWWQR